MRFLLVFLMFFCALSAPSFAKDNIKFIYIHGTNDNSYEKKLEFNENVEKLHPYIVNEFNKSELANKYFLQNGQYKISEKAIPFYWGDQSKNDLNILSDWLDITKFFSPKLAQSVRSMLAHILHDAIWVQKYPNMKPIVNKLHEITSTVAKDNDKYVILGHSAGSFIALEYILYKLPIVDLKEFISAKNLPAKQIAEVEKIGYRTTCIDALIDSGSVIFTKDNQLKIVEENFIENYKKIAEIEKTSCTSSENIAGMITFGSPITLFYSGITNDKDILHTACAKYVVQNNMFFINVNFAEDPLGFPLIADDNYLDLIRYDNSVNRENGENLKYGFMYDKSNIRSNKFVGSAHTAYWAKGKLFSKSLVQAYEEGLTSFFNYDADEDEEI